MAIDNTAFRNSIEPAVARNAEASVRFILGILRHGLRSNRQSPNQHGAASERGDDRSGQDRGEDAEHGRQSHQCHRHATGEVAHEFRPAIFARFCKRVPERLQDITFNSIPSMISIRPKIFA